MKNKISLNPRLVGVVDAILNMVLVVFLEFLFSWSMLLIIFLVKQIIWLLLIRFMYYPLQTIKWRHYLSLCIFSIGFILVILFVESNLVRYIISFTFIFLVFTSFWFLPKSKIELALFFKPHSRWRFIMAVMGLSGIFIGAQAIISFNILSGIHSWWWLILSSLFAILVAAWWWWEYSIKFDFRFLVTVFVFFVLFVEFSWVMYKLPLGHLINGLILVWIWYLLWLFTRFNLTTQGIKWKQQYRFLILNSLLFLFFLLFVVRWK